MANFNTHLIVGSTASGLLATGLLGAGMAEVHAHEPEHPHFHLQFFGVRSALRGRNIGSQLLTGCLEWIDRLGYQASLESSNVRNITVYERLGFHMLAEVEIPEGPIVRPMLRSAGA